MLYIYSSMIEILIILVLENIFLFPPEIAYESDVRLLVSLQ